MKSFNVKSFGLLFLALLAGDSLGQEWVKSGDNYAEDGQITLKRSDGSSISVGLNQRLPTRNSLGRTPNIMVVGGSSVPTWGGAILSSDGNYYIYSETLGDTISYTPAEFNERFEYTLGEQLYNFSLSTYSRTRTESVSGSARSGNDPWLDQGNSASLNSCSSSFDSTPVVFGGSPTGSCDFSAGDGTSTSARWEYRKFALINIANWPYASVSLSVQAIARRTLSLEWSLAFGFSSIETLGPVASMIGNRRIMNGCNYDDPCSGTISHSLTLSSSASVQYYLNDDWRGNGNRFGAVSSDSSGDVMLAVNGTVVPFPSGDVLLNDAGDTHYGWDNGRLVRYAADGSEEEVLVENLGGVAGTPTNVVTSLSSKQ